MTTLAAKLVTERPGMAEPADHSVPTTTVNQDRQPEQPDSPRTAKRRQSSPSDPLAKRARLSAEGSADSPSTIRASPHGSPPPTVTPAVTAKDKSSERRKDSVQEERKRGQRLFGGLLNTLSQSTTNSQQKRRLEIEKRQQEKARLQKAEDESRRTEKLQKLKEVRLLEQVKLDEQSMRIRHSNLLAMAQFLRTKTRPELYYKPWELLPGDTELIEKQIEDAEALIAQEVSEFNERHKPNLASDQPPEKPLSDRPVDDTVGEHEEESSSVPTATATADVTDSTNDVAPSQELQSSTPHVSLGDRDLVDDNNEVVLEGEEDTVIY